MDGLRQKALKIDGVSEFGVSNRKNKRFYVVREGRKIHFGSKTNNTFIDHHDETKRLNWQKRHSQIMTKQLGYAYLDKDQPAYYSWHLLW